MKQKKTKIKSDSRKAKLLRLVNSAPKESKNPSDFVPVVAIGASAGGLEAVKGFLEAMPPKPGMAFVIVQHLDPYHKSMMVELLKKYTTLEVSQAVEQAPIKSNHIYVIPPNKYMSVSGNQLYLTPPLENQHPRLPIDIFFSSLAEDQSERVIGIVLSGTGSDGTHGIKSIKANGGMVMVQSPKDAQFDGMPVSAISTGLVDFVRPVNEIPAVLVKYVQHPYLKGHLVDSSLSEHADLTKILEVLQGQLGQNFHHYKKNTLVRRIGRRMGLQQLENMSDYHQYLKSHKEETEELFKDMLIGVTHFFRDPEVWDHLCNNILPQIVSEARIGVALRIWIPGCSTGEEAYSLAIALMEECQSQQMQPNFQIFATDIDPNAIAIARASRYPEGIQQTISEQRLREFFTKEGGFYTVSARVREHIVFSEQNLISDPPFSKLDFVSCRNLLIYLEAGIQDRIINLFHFSLKKSGILLLGNSETLGRQSGLFKTLFKKPRIFQKVDVVTPNRIVFPILPEERTLNPFIINDTKNLKRKVGLIDLVTKAMLQKYAPNSVLINNKSEILYYYGDTTQFLKYPEGEPTSDFFSLLREGFSTKLRGAVHKAFRDGLPSRVLNGKVKIEGKFQPAAFSVLPLDNLEGGEGLLIVSFFKNEDIRHPIGEQPEGELTDEPMMRQLELELNSTREDLQNTVEEMESANEELKAANEESMSMNEELQAANEELETSKEEMQSLNEELSTVNSELQEKIRNLEFSHNNLKNLINSTSVATIFLDTKLQITFFTPASKNLFSLIGTDLGRPIADISPKFDGTDLQTDALQVIEDLLPSNREVMSREGRTYTRKIFPYRTDDNRIEGIVITFDDITLIRQQQQTLEKEQSLSKRLIENSLIGVFAFDEKLKYTVWNHTMEEIFNLPQAMVLGKTPQEVLPPDLANAEILDFEAALAGESKFVIDREYQRAGGGSRGYFEGHYAPILGESGKVTGGLGAILDVSRHKVFKTIEQNQQDIFRRSQEISNTGNWSLDLDQLRFEFSPEIIKMLDRNPMSFEPSFENFLKCIHPEDKKSVEQNFKKLASKGGSYVEHFRIVQSSGSVRFIQSLSEKILDLEEKPVRFMGILQDITDKVAEEARTKTAEGIKSSILNLIEEPVIYLNQEGLVEWVNLRALEIFGLPELKLIGKKCSDLCASGTGHCDQCPLELARASFKEEQVVVQYKEAGRWLVKVTPLKSEKSEITGFVQRLYKPLMEES
ncbi:MAG: chemotaxis protein CheB [SAR324 cluster bacterium]|nr:chemotaxis protein CheB [SAR324 cluster bacterium]